MAPDAEDMVTVRVLIVDDQAPFRKAAAKMVGRMDGFKVVGEAGSGEEGVALSDVLEPNWCSWMSACQASTVSRPLDGSSRPDLAP